MPKLLIEAGANANFINHDSTSSPLYSALNHFDIKTIKYLIMDRGVEFNYSIHLNDTDSLYLFPIINSFRELAFPLESEEYKIKMEIVEYMKLNGVNYWETPIPQNYYKIYDSLYLSRY